MGSDLALIHFQFKSRVGWAELSRPTIPLFLYGRDFCLPQLSLSHRKRAVERGDLGCSISDIARMKQSGLWEKHRLLDFATFYGGYFPLDRLVSEATRHDELHLQFPLFPPTSCDRVASPFGGLLKKLREVKDV